ncbi:MAG: helix-turn-helix transcriptional regulator, partial [Promethearchaeota archaeon]
IEAIREEELKASPGQIYPFLSTLAEKGYVESSIEKQGDREKKVYHLTPAGKTFVERLLNRFDALIDIAVEPKLTVCASCGAKIYGKSHIETVHGQELAFCCIHCAKSYKQDLEGSS